MVRACTENVTGKVFACKSISRLAMNSTLDMRNLMTEVGAMEAMASHPYVIKLKECLKDDDVSFHSEVSRKITSTHFAHFFWHFESDSCLEYKNDR